MTGMSGGPNSMVNVDGTILRINHVRTFRRWAVGKQKDAVRLGRGSVSGTPAGGFYSCRKRYLSPAKWAQKVIRFGRMSEFFHRKAFRM